MNNAIEISSIKFSPKDPQQLGGSLLCNVSVCINNFITIERIRLSYSFRLGQYFVYFPSFKLEGKFSPYVIMDSEIKEKITEGIISQYKRMLAIGDPQQVHDRRYGEPPVI